MSVKITTLVENSPGENLALNSEHGIAFFIEKDGHHLLFDTGQTKNFIINAQQLQLNLMSLEYVVLSHGHYDHSGGLRALVELTTDFKLILGQGFFNPKYGYQNGRYEYLGNNFDETFLQENNISYRFTTQALTQVCPGVFVVTNFSRTHPDEIQNPRFKILRNETMCPDPFDDEVLVAVDSPRGLVVLLGCSHPGMKNMLDTVRNLIKRPLYAVLGGTHLIEADKSSQEQSLTYLDRQPLQVVGVSHCTGSLAMERLANSNSHYFHNRTGSALFIN